ncbi:OpgC family protein [Mesorhizobium retamae]|uniref:OpgC domain-containing protein n=1 Tax=Mesorhizobium retamae TaxID=2912854 RepID=A0ABS9QE76_9HYPH|nr:OpgC domain-containing protein [Mesorhizobium sp. IRAMC:0171]MCG7505729.1 OpgC domain-containing protein [Mesorhizobium sp. IRAMC:0171]
MTTPLSSERDTRIDVLRGVALLMIFIDHVPGTVFELFTYKNFGFSDAAEGFVLISGISVALAYGRKFQPGNRLLATLKMWRRAGVLYSAHIVATMASIAIFCAAALLAKRPDFLTQINIGPLIERTPEVLVGIATLSHQIGYNNILPLYAVLLLAAPALLFLGGRWPLPTLMLSGLVWLWAGLDQVAPPNYPEQGFWFLNPLSWQFLFTIGIVGTLHVRRGGSIPVNGWLLGLAAIYAVIALVWVRGPWWGQDTWFGLPPVLAGFDKTFLSLSRLLHVLSIAYLIVAVPAVSAFFRKPLDHPLAILGKRSLPVFVAGTVLAIVAQVLKLVRPGGFSYDTMLIATGITAQFAFAYYLEWLSRLGWTSEAKAPQQGRGFAGHLVSVR